MNGVVEVWFPSTGAGRIRGENNQYFDFSNIDWKSNKAPERGQQVTFTPESEKAIHIRLMGGSGPLKEVPVTGSHLIPEGYSQKLPGSGFWVPGFAAVTLALFLPIESSGWSESVFFLESFYLMGLVFFLWKTLQRMSDRIHPGYAMYTCSLPPVNIVGLPFVFFFWVRDFNTKGLPYFPGVKAVSMPLTLTVGFSWFLSNLYLLGMYVLEEESDWLPYHDSLLSISILGRLIFWCSMPIWIHLTCQRCIWFRKYI